MVKLVSNLFLALICSFCRAYLQPSTSSSIIRNSLNCIVDKRNECATTKIYMLDSDDDSKDQLVYKDSSSQPKFGIKSLDDVKSTTTKSNNAVKGNSKKSSTIYSETSSTSKEQATKKTSSPFGSLTIEDLKKRMVPLENAEGKPLPKRTEDLNGINPLTPLVSSSVPFTMAFLGYKLTSYLTATFAVQFLTSDVYTLQRIAIVARNILVGLTTLATTFCGVIGLGLFLLGLTVGVGVLKGELDPNKKEIDVNK